ncbi:MSHA biogenesis protein MshM [hydrothermal vent metagenome]|uniref:MSHA biogenesis protein MshM n=1 Tax=hydrothermal vent metagenome TaxID=652676 RepID=A0A3B1A7D6_9ZZZZ
MYQQHFGLITLPFSLSPDTDYFFTYGHYSNALNTLVVALRTGEGFIKVTGEVGIGKTILCRRLLNYLDEDFLTVYVPNPLLSPMGLYLAVAQELGIDINRYTHQHLIMNKISEQLINLTQQGQRVVLCLDEAQAMPDDTLEALRLLTNIETEKSKLLQVVLFGQPELNERLSHRSVRQLRQRIVFSYDLKPIDRQGMDAYLDHRLRIAGYMGMNLFHPLALKNLYQASHGIPRLINILSHKALLIAYGRGSKIVEPRFVDIAINDTEETSNQLINIRYLLRNGLAVVSLLAITLASSYFVIS